MYGCSSHVYSVKVSLLENRYMASYSPLAQDPVYATVWMFWVRNVATVFVPFLFLLLLNWRIWTALRHQHTWSVSSGLMRAIAAENSQLERRGWHPVFNEQESN